MDHPRAGLTFMSARDLDHSFDFDRLDVVSSGGEALGKVDGFIIDVRAVRPYYVVVSAGGWFTSKYFLLAIGHATLTADARTLLANVSRDRVAEYPGFDRGTFDEISDEELGRFDQAMITICSLAEAEAGGTSMMFRTPNWWDPMRDRSK